jgi:hypothetical protein
MVKRKIRGNDRIFMFLTVFAVLASIVSVFLVYLSVDTLVNEISGLVTTGEANLTVETILQVNFTTNSINWSSGRVNQASTAASLITVGAGTIEGGNWTADSGLIIENIGNVNVSLNFSVGLNASDFIGGSNPVYEWNLSDKATEANSCTNAAGSGDPPRFDLFYQANTTPSTALGGIGCSIFRFESANDQIRLDFNITVPEDSLTGGLGDVITATVTAL